MEMEEQVPGRCVVHGRETVQLPLDRFETGLTLGKFCKSKACRVSCGLTRPVPLYIPAAATKSSCRSCVIKGIGSDRK